MTVAAARLREPAPSAVPWWREAVIYQVYVRSFADADGDGVGDLPGVCSRLPYLRQLGVDALWLTPFYPSPQADAGYDVADHRDVDPLFGTLANLDAVVAEGHDLGLRVMVDIVPNHTSSRHAWFRQALAAGPGSRERARYVFRAGRGRAGDQPPNDWESNFGGSAWTRVTEPDGRAGQWYLHLFDPGQPDLDWMNLDVREEFESILRFWLDRGVDGFRIDVAHGLAKDPEMPDLAGAFAAEGPAKEGHPHWDLDAVHDVYRGWRRIADSYPGERAFVAEVWLADPRRVARYVRPDELHTAFNFHLLLAPWQASSIREAIDTSLGAASSVGAPATWVLSNHDVTRHLSRYGGGELGTLRARAAALLMFSLPGGAYVYQGEELGLPEVADLPDELRQDPTFRRTAGALLGRDGCRVPLPWSGASPPFGFSVGGRAWLPQPEAWSALTAERQAAEPDSMLALYRAALAWRRQLTALGDGTLEWIDGGDDLLVYRRDPRFVGAVNFAEEAARLPAGVGDVEVVLASRPLDDTRVLPGTTAAWYRTMQ